MTAGFDFAALRTLSDLAAIGVDPGELSAARYAERRYRTKANRDGCDVGGHAQSTERVMTARRCCACLTLFGARRPEHALCRRCWAWIAAGRHLRMLARRLAETRT